MTGREEYDPGEGRHNFERPETLLNRSLRWMADRRPHAELPQAHIDELRDNSIDVFSGIVVDHEALGKVRSETTWYMAEDSCPSMVLSGEVTVDDDEQNPEVRFFADAPVLTYKNDDRREVGLLSAADHFTGHLYAYFTGAVDYDEHAAVYWQNRAAVARAEAGDKRFRSLPFLNMLGYKNHKQIPFGVYSPRSLPLVGPLAEGTPSVEVCELRDPGVTGWSRVTTDSDANGVITQYDRPIPAVNPGISVIPGGGDEQVAWEVVLGGTEPGSFDRLFLTKEGRPLSSDIEIIADFEKGLRTAGVSPIEEPTPKMGGFPQVLGY